MGKIIAFSNQKGGVGKTTTCVNMSAYLAAKGYKVLIVDLDPQGNATSGLGFAKSEIKNSVYKVMIDEMPIVDAVVKTCVENLDILPSNIDLAGAEVELVYVKDREKVQFDYIKSFFTVADIAAISLSVAHALGRIGCLMAGCCHGAKTDAWYGIYMPALKAKVVPLQLYEAIFLFALSAWFIYRLFKGMAGNLPLYMASYGVWRFAIEFLRDDDRGSTVVDFLTPSQFIALLMIVGAVLLFFGQRYLMKKQSEKDSDEVVNE